MNLRISRRPRTASEWFTAAVGASAAFALLLIDGVRLVREEVGERASVTHARREIRYHKTEIERLRGQIRRGK